MAQLHIANSIDYGNPLQPGTFVGAQAQNPKLQSWSPTGPVWGAPDGCGYNFIFNNLKAPWTDVNIRTGDQLRDQSPADQRHRLRGRQLSGDRARSRPT